MEWRCVGTLRSTTLSNNAFSDSDLSNRYCGELEVRFGPLMCGGCVDAGAGGKGRRAVTPPATPCDLL